MEFLIMLVASTTSILSSIIFLHFDALTYFLRFDNPKAYLWTQSRPNSSPPNQETGDIVSQIKCLKPVKNF